MRRRRKQKNSPEWIEFEKRTKRFLEALGYSVDHDELSYGSQVDLRAILNGKMFGDEKLVECKHTAKNVGIGDVRQLYSRVQLAREKSPNVTGLMVSRVGFTRDARSFAGSQNLTLMTIAELGGMTFNPEPILQNAASFFDSEPLGTAYVDLSCQVREHGAGTVYKPVEAFLDQFLYSTRRLGVAVLGNFGTGKTTLCRHYAYLLAKHWLDGAQDTFLPIYISLREYRNFHRFEETLLDVVTQYGCETNRDGLREWLANGRTLLLLDGFDEMASNLNKQDISTTLDALTRFASQFDVKIVLTCRTHFFKSEIQENALKGMLRLYVRDWGESELVEFVTNSTLSDSSQSLKFIRDTYNLEELARTPIFLRMITETIQQLGSGVNQAKLYQVYTDRWIQSQDYRSSVSPDDKLDFMIELAWQLFRTGQSHISHQSLPRTITSIVNFREYESVVAFDEDIRTCSFLIRNDEGYYYFVHKSFMEYFVARRLSDRTKNGDYSDISEYGLTLEIAGFMANYFEGERDVLIRQLLGHKEETFRANCARVLGCMSSTSKGVKAFQLALETEQSDVVLDRVVEGLRSYGGNEVIEMLTTYASISSPLGEYCLRSIAEYANHNVVTVLFSDVLAGENTVRISIVLRAIADYGDETLRSALSNFLSKRRSWRGEEEIEIAVVDAIAALADLDLALAAQEFLTDDTVNESLRARLSYLCEDLSKRFASSILAIVQGYRRDGRNYKQSEGALRGKFRFVSDIVVKSVLESTYPPTRTKIKRLKRNDPKIR